MPIKLSAVRQAAAEALVFAGTAFRPDQAAAWERAIAAETRPNAKWLLELTLENARVAAARKLPLCDDTGIPHVLLEVGEKAEIEGGAGQLLRAVNDGIADGLRALPGRPMAVRGGERTRLAQSSGLHADPARLAPAPVMVRPAAGKNIRLTVLMLGGGPEIRSRTWRVFHHHDAERVIDEVAGWAAEMVGLLGCTPCVPAVGIGRTHYEATCLMLEAMAGGVFGSESEFEALITRRVNETGVGPLGLGGSVSALGSFVKIGPQRASGVRIACLRLGCSVDPRRASVVPE